MLYSLWYKSITIASFYSDFLFGHWLLTNCMNFCSWSTCIQIKNKTCHPINCEQRRNVLAYTLLVLYLSRLILWLIEASFFRIHLRSPGTHIRWHFFKWNKLRNRSIWIPLVKMGVFIEGSPRFWLQIKFIVFVWLKLPFRSMKLK